MTVVQVGSRIFDNGPGTNKGTTVDFRASIFRLRCQMKNCGRAAEVGGEKMRDHMKFYRGVACDTCVVSALPYTL